MTQVLKPEVRARIEDAAVRCFAADGYRGASMTAIAAAAGTAPANLYRYYRSKETLFDSVVPSSLARRHDSLLDTRIAALAAGGSDGAPAAELLSFWLEHRHAMIVLLGKAEGTRFAPYPGEFVERLTRHARATLTTHPSPEHEEVLRLVFDNTRRAIVRILAAGLNRDRTSALITAFWSYQIPGLHGLLAFIDAPGTAPGPEPD